MKKLSHDCKQNSLTFYFVDSVSSVWKKPLTVARTLPSL